MQPERCNQRNGCLPIPEGPTGNSPMSSVHNPKEKKRLAYARDHYAKNKADKARNHWGIKKQNARRAFRHAVNSLTQAAALDGGSDEKISAVSQQRVRRWPV